MQEEEREVGTEEVEGIINCNGGGQQLLGFQMEKSSELNYSATMYSQKQQKCPADQTTLLSISNSVINDDISSKQNYFLSNQTQIYHRQPKKPETFQQRFSLPFSTKAELLINAELESNDFVDGKAAEMAAQKTSGLIHHERQFSHPFQPSSIEI